VTSLCADERPRRSHAAGSRSFRRDGGSSESSPSRRTCSSASPLGLAPTIVDHVFATLQAIAEHGIGVLLVEQRAQRTVALAQRTHVLANGELRLTLTPDDAADTERMVAAYLS
jgi:hypothetical protein